MTRFVIITFDRETITTRPHGYYHSAEVARLVADEMADDFPKVGIYILDTKTGKIVYTA